MITIPRQQLLSALERVSKVAAKKSPLPIITCALFEAEGKRLRYAATDMKLSIAGHLLCEGTGRFVADPSELAGAAQSLSGEFVKLDIKPGSLQVSADGKRRFKVSTLSADDFPPIVKMPSEGTSLPVNFRESLQRVAYGMLQTSGDERPNMRGIHCKVSNGAAVLSTTDGHRLAQLSTPADGALEFLLPSGAHHALMKTEGELSFADSETELFFRTGSETLAARKLDAQFPPVEQVLAFESHHRFRVDAAALSDAMAAVARIKSLVVLGLNGDSVTIDADKGDSDAHDEIAAKCSATGRIGVESRYMIEALKGITGEVEVEHGGELDPLRFRHDGYTAVIMPVRI